MAYGIETTKAKNNFLTLELKMEDGDYKGKRFNSFYEFLITAMLAEKMGIEMYDPNNPDETLKVQWLLEQLKLGPNGATTVGALMPDDITSNPATYVTTGEFFEEKAIYLNEAAGMYFYVDGANVQTFSMLPSNPVAHFELEGKLNMGNNTFTPEHIIVVNYDSEKNSRKKLVAFRYTEFNDFLKRNPINLIDKNIVIAEQFADFNKAFDLEAVFDPFGTDYRPYRSREPYKSDPIALFVELKKVGVKLEQAYVPINFNPKDTVIKAENIKNTYVKRQEFIKDKVKQIVVAYPNSEGKNAHPYSNAESTRRTLDLVAEYLPASLHKSFKAIYGKGISIKTIKVEKKKLTSFKPGIIYVIPETEMLLDNEGFNKFYAKHEKNSSDYYLFRFKENIETIFSGGTHDGFITQIVGGSLFIVSNSRRGLTMATNFLDEYWNPHAITKFYGVDQTVKLKNIVYIPQDDLRLISLARDSVGRKSANPFIEQEENAKKAQLLSRRLENGLIIEDSYWADLLKGDRVTKNILASVIKNYGDNGIKTYIKINPRAPRILSQLIETDSISAPDVQAFWKGKINDLVNDYGVYFGGFVMESNQNTKRDEDEVAPTDGDEPWMNLAIFFAEHFEQDTTHNLNLIWKVPLMNPLETKKYKRNNNLVNLDAFKVKARNAFKIKEYGKHVTNPDFVQFFAYRIKYEEYEWDLMLYNDLDDGHVYRPDGRTY